MSKRKLATALKNLALVGIVLNLLFLALIKVTGASKNERSVSEINSLNFAIQTNDCSTVKRQFTEVNKCLGDLRKQHCRRASAGECDEKMSVWAFQCFPER